MQYRTRNFLAGLLIAVQPAAAVAHPLHWAGQSIGFVGGLLHPLTGTDHLLTLLAVALLAGRFQSWRAHLLPPLFTACMLLGCGMSLIAADMPDTQAIAVLLAVVLVPAALCRRRIAYPAAVALVGCLALCHGREHALDIWLDEDLASHTAGFAVSTLLLLETGMAVRRVVFRFAYQSARAVFKSPSGK